MVVTTVIVLSQSDDAFDFGSALEDGDRVLGGGDDVERLRGGESEGLEMGLAVELEGDAMDGGMERWVVREEEGW